MPFASALWPKICGSISSVFEIKKESAHGTFTRELFVDLETVWNLYATQRLHRHRYYGRKPANEPQLYGSSTGGTARWEEMETRLYPRAVRAIELQSHVKTVLAFGNARRLARRRCSFAIERGSTEKYVSYTKRTYTHTRTPTRTQTCRYANRTYVEPTKQECSRITDGGCFFSQIIYV